MSIEAAKCDKCQRVIVPPRDICPYCGVSAGKMTHTMLDNGGTILSYTVLQMPPEGFQPPVLLALVKLDDGATTLCLGDTTENGDVQIGARVRVYKDLTDRLLFRVDK